jgi:SAM-dependent methyltransferase
MRWMEFCDDRAEGGRVYDDCKDYLAHKVPIRSKNLPQTGARILDIGCGNNSPTITKHWFPGCYYAGADIQQYNNNDEDMRAMDEFYLLGSNGSGYEEIPDRSFDLVILHHVIEHISDPMPIVAMACQKIRPGGYIWIAFPSQRSLSLPPAAQGALQFCDDITHVYVPDIRETSNVFLANGIRVLHAGRTMDAARIIVGAMVLPIAFLRKAMTGRLNARGLWYILGFEDHVFGQRSVDQKQMIEHEK